MGFWACLQLAFMLATVRIPASPTVDQTYEYQVLEQVNQIRRSYNLPALILCPELSKSARDYALYMGNRDFFEHRGPNGSTCVSRNEAAGYKNWRKLRENLAAGYKTPAEVVEGWMKSPSHRTNILSDDVTETGVGYANVPGSYYGRYWVQEFGARRESKKPLRPQMNTDGHR